MTLHLLVDDVVAQPPSQGRGGRERDEQRPRPVQADGVAEPAAHRWLREPRRRARHAQPYLLQGRSPGLRAAPLPCGADSTHEVVRPETREAQADHHATHRLSGGGDDRHGDPEQGHERRLQGLALAASARRIEQAAAHGVTLQFVECRTHGGDVLEAWRAATDGVDDRALQGRDVGGWDRPRLEAPVRRLTQISPFEQIRRRRLQCGCAAVEHADLLGCHVACADVVRLGRHGVLLPLKHIMPAERLTGAKRPERWGECPRRQPGGARRARPLASCGVRSGAGVGENGRMTTGFGWHVVVAIACLLVMIQVGYRASGVKLTRTSLVAVARACVQLTLAALLITSVVRYLWASVLAVAVMFIVAVLTTTKRSGATDVRARLAAALAMAAGLVPVLVILTVSGVVPMKGVSIIPTAGIVIGNVMSVHTLVSRRAFDGLREEKNMYEAGLSIGMLPRDAISEVIARRLPESLIPVLDQTRTAGMVTLPGAFIGVMLGGGSAVQAATAQVVVSTSILAAQAVTSAVEQRMICARRLLTPQLRETLID